MSSDSKKSVTRRELLALTGGALGAASLVARGAQHFGSAPAATAEAGTASRVVNSVDGAKLPSAPAGLAEVDATPRPSAPAGEWVAPPALPAGRQQRVQALPAAGPETLAAFGGLRPGSIVGRWTIAAIHEVHLGGIPVILSDARGQKFQVDVLARDASVRGIAESTALAFFVANEGNGDKSTVEDHGLAAMALAAVVTRRGAAVVPAGLLSLSARQSAFSGGDFRVAV